MEVISDIVQQFVDPHKLTFCCQIIVGIRQRTDEMSCEKPVQHQEKIALELDTHLLFKFLFIQLPADHGPDVLIEGIVFVNGIKAAFQDVGTDIQFISVQDHALAGLADNFEIPVIQLITQLFEVTDQSGAANIHFVSQLIGQKRLVCPHQFPEHIVLTAARRIEKSVRVADPFIYFLIFGRIENPEAVTSLDAFNRSTSFKILIELPYVIADRSLADAQLLCYYCHGQTGFRAKNPQDTCCPVVCE